MIHHAPHWSKFLLSHSEQGECYNSLVSSSQSGSISKMDLNISKQLYEVFLLVYLVCINKNILYMVSRMRHKREKPSSFPVNPLLQLVYTSRNGSILIFRL
jgi:hypothetical protein